MALNLNAQEAQVALQLDPDLLTDEVLRHPLKRTQPPVPHLVMGFTPVQRVVDMMRRERTPAVVVCDPVTGKLRGLLTERDVLRLMAEGLDLTRTPIEEVMTHNPFCHGPWDSIGFALNKMVVDGYRTIPLIDSDGRPVGLVTRAHLLRYLCKYLHAVPSDDLDIEREQQANEKRRGDEMTNLTATG